MRKRILDAGSALLLALCCITASNIKENAPVNHNNFGETAEAMSPSLDESTLRAGVCRAFSESSFTTESGEKTGIEKRDVQLVASSNEADNEKDSIEAYADGEGIAVEAANVTPADENRWGITLTEDEIDLLARIVWLEACGEPVEGQEAVVEVVFNRMASDLYPNTLYEVLSQKNPVQFCSYKNRDIAEPTEKEYESIQQVLSGNTNLLRNDTMNFSTYMLTSNLDVQICCHYFCY